MSVKFANFLDSDVNYCDGVDYSNCAVTVKKRRVNANNFNSIFVADGVIHVNYELNSSSDRWANSDENYFFMSETEKQRLCVSLLNSLIVAGPTLFSVFGERFSSFKQNLTKIFDHGKVDELSSIGSGASYFFHHKESGYVWGLIDLSVLDTVDRALFSESELASLSKATTYRGINGLASVTAIFCWAKTTQAEKLFAWHLHPVRINETPPIEFFHDTGAQENLQAIKSKVNVLTLADIEAQTFDIDFKPYGKFQNCKNDAYYSIVGVTRDTIKQTERLGFKFDYLTLGDGNAVVVCISAFMHDLLTLVNSKEVNTNEMV